MSQSRHMTMWVKENSLMEKAGVTTEDDEEKTQFSQLNQGQNEDNGEAETLDSHLQPNTDDKSSDSCDGTGKWFQSDVWEKIYPSLEPKDTTQKRNHTAVTCVGKDLPVSCI
ncbi:hypothetical protein PAMP_009912 [Pampus punctatissimus]